MHLCCQNQKDVPYNVVPSVLSWQWFQLLKSEMFLYNFAEFFFVRKVDESDGEKYLRVGIGVTTKAIPNMTEVYDHMQNMDQ